MDLPKIAISVRMPWAWAIFHADPVKNIENRDWREPNPGLRFRGPVAIQASSGMTQQEYESAAETIQSITGKPPPPARDLQRGGIIGHVIVDEIIRASQMRGDPKWLSPWFFGPCGLVLKRPTPCEFIPCKGQLGFFEWRPGDPVDVPVPALWMLKKEVKEVESVPPQRELF